MTTCPVTCATGRPCRMRAAYTDGRCWAHSGTDDARAARAMRGARGVAARTGIGPRAGGTDTATAPTDPTPDAASGARSAPSRGSARLAADVSTVDALAETVGRAMGMVADGVIAPEQAAAIGRLAAVAATLRAPAKTRDTVATRGEGKRIRFVVAEPAETA